MDLPSSEIRTAHLPIVKLSLSGFIVDAGPFRRWFDPSRLRQIDFEQNCIDAGFALPVRMARHITITWPQGKLRPEVINMTNVNRADVKLIKLKKGRVVSTTVPAPRGNNLLPSKWLPGHQNLGTSVRTLTRKRAMTFKRKQEDEAMRLLSKKRSGEEVFGGDLDMF